MYLLTQQWHTEYNAFGPHFDDTTPKFPKKLQMNLHHHGESQEKWGKELGQISKFRTAFAK